MVLNITTKLLKWYDKEKRLLPWRKTGKEKSDAYSVWVSEIMLQQTTVNAVRNKYKNFILRFPNVNVLAQAPLEDVLEEWAGLGYYRRARNLHTSAREVVNKHEGVIPSEEEELIRLPGIGSYTSAAIRAIAYNKCSLAIDVNVERVITRLFNITSDKNLKDKIIKSAQPLVPNNRPGDFTEALMDLGSLICKKLDPGCKSCPLKTDCKGFLNNSIKISVNNNESKKIRVGECYAIKRLSDNKLLFFRNPPKGLFGSMLLLPTYGWFGNSQDDYIKNKVKNFTKEIHNKKYKKIINYDFSHFKLKLKIYYIETNSVNIEYGEWLSIDKAVVQLPTLMKKVIDVIIDN